MVEFTERALEVLTQAEAAARRFNPAARIRLRRDAGGVHFDLTDEPVPGDATVERHGFTLFVEPGLEGTVDADDHNILSLS